MTLVTLFTGLRIAHLIREFHRKYEETGPYLPVLGRIRESYQSVPTYLRAVKVDNEFVAYLWASVLGGVCFIQHVYSQNRDARRLLMNDLENWCSRRGITQIAGMRKYALAKKVFTRWMRMQGYRPTQVVYSKMLEGDNGRESST